MSSDENIDLYDDSEEDPLWSDESDDGDDMGLIDVLDHERKCPKAKKGKRRQRLKIDFRGMRF
jgi:hypothetical protein